MDQHNINEISSEQTAVSVATLDAPPAEPADTVHQDSADTAAAPELSKPAVESEQSTAPSQEAEQQATPQNYVIPQQPATPQGYPAQQYTVPQGAPVQPNTAPQGYVVPQQPAAPQGYPAQQYTVPQGAPAQPNTAPQGYVVPQQPAAPQGYPAQQYAPPIQQGGYAAPLYSTQPPQGYTLRPQPNQVGGKESFIGINLLSKIGVIFIIIGVIAFSAVSEDFLLPEIRTAIIFVLGLAMMTLGEVFYRISSVIFARALTIGGIAELAISVLIGHAEYETLNEIASLIFIAVIAAGGILLSLRYKSQTIVTVTAVSGFVGCYAALESTIPLFLTMLYLILFQTALVIVCEKKSWFVTPFFMLGCNLVFSIIIWNFMLDQLEHSTAALIATAFVVITSLIPIINTVVNSFCNFGSLNSYNTVVYIISTAAQLLISMLFIAEGFDTLAGYGVLALFLGLAHLAVAALLYTSFEKCSLLTAMTNSALSCLCLAALYLPPEGYFYIVFHVFAAALLIFGYLARNKTVKIWGIVTCGVSEYIFTLGIIPSLFDDGNRFLLQFSVNAALWLAILVALALRKPKGGGFIAYSILAITNTIFYGLYLVSFLLDNMRESGVFHSISEKNTCFMLFAAIIWMAAAFITGKLKFLKNAAPVMAMIYYFFALSGIGITNLASSADSPMESTICLVASIVVNLISVAAVLDITFAISKMAPKLTGIVGLIVSLYAMLCVTFTLSANHIVAFSNCIISIIYLAVAIAWIVWGFAGKNVIMRRFGLALTLLASAKLFLLDFSEIGAVGKTLMFILFGIILLTVSFIYAIFENKLKKQQQAELYQQQLEYYNYYNNVQNRNNQPPKQ